MTLQAQGLNDPLGRSIRRVLLLLFLCSGVSGLIYEVVWTRLLTVILGNTVYAVSTVLTVFMGGLALGSFFGGRIIDRRKDPLRVYAFLELAIGASGYCLTLILNQTGPVYVWIHSALGEYPLVLCGARYVFSFSLLAIPTLLMGATFPVLSKFVAGRERAVGLDIGTLYALNTLGAAGGCYLAGFVLIGNIGTGLTVSTASALSIAVGGLAWYCHKLAGPVKLKTSRQPAEESDGDPTRSPLQWLILSAFAISGCAALGYEVVWTRILISYLGNSVYAFSTMLTTFLVGIAFGSLCFSRFVDRRKRLVTGFGFIHVAIGFYVLLSIYAFGWYADSLELLRQPRPVWEGTGIRFVKAFALMFVPTFLMGAALPVAGRAYITNFRRLGRSLGELYAWNTVGAIVGAAAAGFALMPALGLESSLVVLLSLNLCIGITLCGAEPAMDRKRRFLLLGGLAAATGLGLGGMPRSVFRQMHEVRSPGVKLTYYKEDLVGTVTVTEKGDNRTLFIDHLELAGTDDRFLSSHKSLGHLPMLLHPNPRSVYVLGFGGGGTAYAISTYPEVKRIDATELSRSVVDVVPRFTAINHHVMSDPRLHLEVNDGRHFLLTTRRTYDVISVDLLWPQTAGSGSLYTKEFYELCHRRLNDGGIMVEWLHSGFIPTQYLKIILRTIRRVFPHTSLWWSRRQEHLLVVASKAPLRVDFQRLARRMNHPATQRDLAEVYLEKPASFLGYFIAGDDALARFVKGSELLNTDDLPYLEYKLPFNTASAELDNLRAMTRIGHSVLPRVEHVNSEQKEEILVHERSNEFQHQAIIALCEGRHAAALAECRRALEVNPHNRDALELFAHTHQILNRPQRQTPSQPDH
ncbi:MAG: fused MFS/spermidine synthase [Planctomycetota bacterium]|jgi:spermidine synthase